MPALLGDPAVAKDERDSLLAFLQGADGAVAEFNAWRDAGGDPGADKAARDAATAKLLAAAPLVEQVAKRMQSGNPSDWERLTWYEARALADFSDAASSLRAVARAHPAPSVAVAQAAEGATPFWAYLMVGVLGLGAALMLFGFQVAPAKRA